jgi:hypothetical protein
MLGCLSKDWANAPDEKHTKKAKTVKKERIMNTRSRMKDYLRLICEKLLLKTSGLIFFKSSVVYLSLTLLTRERAD